MENENKTFNFGSEKLSNAVIEGESNFFKADIGEVYTIEVLKDKPISPRTVTFENKQVSRFDIHIKVDEKELIWSIGKRNLKFINDSPTNKFNVLRTSEKYNIIPLK